MKKPVAGGMGSASRNPEAWSYEGIGFRDAPKEKNNELGLGGFGVVRHFRLGVTSLGLAFFEFGDAGCRF